MKELREHVMKGISNRTHAFNADTFPQSSPDWTPEQVEIFNFLNGESGGFSRIADSDKPEIAKTLAKIAGITDMKSRFDVRNTVSLPPYCVVVLREDLENYPKFFPLVSARITGLWNEVGAGSSRMLIVRGSQLRPATEDDIEKIRKKFPDDKLPKLFGAIEFPSLKKLRHAIAEMIKEQTAKLAESLTPVYPEGITEKGKQLVQAGLAYDENMLRAMSIILEDPALLKPFTPVPSRISFLPYSAVVHASAKGGMSYAPNRVHVQAGINPDDVFFSWPDEATDLVGNHADSSTANFRTAYEDEVDAYVKSLPDNRLHLYVEGLSVETIKALL